MDIINHILQEIKLEDRNLFVTSFCRQHGIDFNYLFLDEVQDLPPGAIYLISLMFNNGIYYSGDTAQAIKKGVCFRFSDITDMYTESSIVEPLSLKTPALHKLTVNFRSHSEILNLANNIIDIILELFPTSIDRMKKEIAKEKGPKPIILNNEK